MRERFRAACMSVLLLGGAAAVQAGLTYGPVTLLDGLGSERSSANGINDHGAVVGDAYMPDSSGMLRSQGFLFEGGAYTLFEGPAGSTSSTAFGISNAGVMVGTYRQAGSAAQSYIWEAGVYSTLGLPGAESTEVRSVSSDGRYVAGHAVVLSALVGFVHDRVSGTWKIIDGAAVTQGVNIHGQVTGSFQSRFVSPGRLERGSFIYDFLTDTKVEITDVAGFGPSFRGINDDGLIVGFGGGRSFVGRSGDWTLLDTGSSGFSLAYGVNKHGVVVGFINSQVGAKAFVIAPNAVPEPATLALCLAALGAAGWGRRQGGRVRSCSTRSC